MDFPNSIPPTPSIVIITIITVSILIITLCVLRFRTKPTTSNSNAKFRSPLRNMNFCYLIVILTFSLLHLIFHFHSLPKGILFPVFPLGTGMLLCTSIIILTNHDAKEHAKKKWLKLKNYIHNNSVGVASVPASTEGPQGPSGHQPRARAGPGPRAQNQGPGPIPGAQSPGPGRHAWPGRLGLAGPACQAGPGSRA